MKALAQFRNEELSRKIVRAIERLSADLGNIKIMNFCGTHEWTISHYGIRYLMPDNVELVAGPGCPVCITPSVYIEQAIKLSMEGIRVYTYGDTFKLPKTGLSSPRSLEEAKASGADVRVVYSILDAIKMSRDGRQSLFFAVGFETTAPSTLTQVMRRSIPDNLKFLIAYRLTPPIMRYTLDNFPESPIRGVIAPGHVSAVTGAKAWEFLPKEYGIPTVVSGFEPIDVLLTILEILKQNKEGKSRLVNEYSRVVTWEGNLEAKKAIRETCDVVNAAWRGIGYVPMSGLTLKEKYRSYDAKYSFGLIEPSAIEWKRDLPPGCKCAEVTLGIAKPTDCPHFLTRCTPDRPYGPCMVSSEGTCFIWAKYGGRMALKDL